MRLLPAELRLAFRSLARRPLFATVAIASLGIALALNTTMFGLVDAILHPPVPYPDPERLYAVRWRGGDPRADVPPEVRYRALKEGLPGAAGIAGASPRAVPCEVDGVVVSEWVARVTPEYFRVVGVAPLHGRTFGPGSAAAREAIVEFALWRRAFGERPLSSGLTITIGEQPFTVVGVMPPGMRLGAGGVWIPDGSDEVPMGRMEAMVRVRPGVTRERFNAELALVARRIDVLSGVPDRPWAAWAFSIADEQRPRLDGFQKFLLAVVGGVLAIACANLATLLLARGAARRRELAVRQAIGATRWGVAREVLAECGVIAFGGAALGLLLTRWAMTLVPHWAPAHVPQLGEFVPGISWRVFAFALLVALVVMVAAGVLPALHASRVPPAEPLKDGAGTTRRRRERWSGLVVAEVALSTMLLMFAALLVMGSWRMARFEFGFDAQRLIAASVSLPRDRVLAPGERARLREEVATRLRAIPGVRDAASWRQSGPDGPIVMGENGRAGEKWVNVRWHKVVSPSFLHTMGIPVVQGRDFADGDASGPDPVVIVDHVTARRLWPDVPSAVGRMIKLGDERSAAPWLRVVGVAQRLGRAPDTPGHAPDDPQIYVVEPRDSAGPGQYVISTTTRDARMVSTIRRELRRTVGPARWISASAWSAQFDETLRWTGFLAMLFTALSAFALVLCAVGLYGVLAYTVSQRLREFAIRIALGARSPAVARLVVRDASVMALAGIGIGALCALGATFGLATEYLDIRYAHARALVAAEAVLLLVATAAAWAPVRRGMRADPASMLQAN